MEVFHYSPVLLLSWYVDVCCIPHCYVVVLLIVWFMSEPQGGVQSPSEGENRWASGVRRHVGVSIVMGDPQ